jgi:hypothetical protein
MWLDVQVGNYKGQYAWIVKLLLCFSFSWHVAR